MSWLTGYRRLSPRVARGNGQDGWAADAPYDRLVATCTVSEIPYAWIEQTPAGRIVAPWGGTFHPYSYATLDVADGKATGRFSGRPAFIRSRTERSGGGYCRDFQHHLDDGTPSKTGLCPQDLVHDADALFYVGLALTDTWHHVGNADDGSDEFTWWIFANDKSSWATADYVPGQEVYEVDQYGSRNLWDETHAAYRLWEGLGKPGRDRAGLTVNRQGQRIWLDGPGNIIH